MRQDIDYDASTPIQTVKTFFSEPPPRAANKRMRALLLRLTGRSAGATRILGIVIIGLTLFLAPFICIFAPWSLPSEMALTSGKGKRKTLLITRMEKTNALENDVRIYRVYARHPGENASQPEIINYYTGTNGIPGLNRFDNNGRANPPVEVDALASVDDPGLAILPGGRLSTFSPLLALIPLVFLVPLLILIVVWFRIRRRNNIRPILRDGVLTTAKVIDWQETSVVVNNRIRHQIELSFPTEYGLQETTTVHAYGDEAERYRRCLMDNLSLPGIYIPGNPQKAVFLPVFAEEPA